MAGGVEAGGHTVRRRCLVEVSSLRGPKAAVWRERWGQMMTPEGDYGSRNPGHSEIPDLVPHQVEGVTEVA